MICRMRPLVAVAAFALAGNMCATSPANAVVLPGEYPVIRFDLARGAGTHWHSCIGQTTFGPGIAPDDLEVTYVQENSFKIAIKGTEDALICGGFYPPPLRQAAHRAIFRFFDANRWSFEDIDRRTNLRQRATLAGAPMLAAAPVKCVVDGKILYTEGECPKGGKPAAIAGSQPEVPAVQRGLWKLSGSFGDGPTPSEYCGDPLEALTKDLGRAHELHSLGCSIRTTSTAPRHFNVIRDCPADRVSADGSRRIQKGRVSIDVTAPTQQSFTIRTEGVASTPQVLRGTRIGDCQ